MDRWISQLYILTALLILSVFAILFSLSPTNTPRFKITYGEPGMPVIDKRTMRFDGLNSILDELRASPNTYINGKLVKERRLTPEEFMQYLERRQPANLPLIQQGVPIGDPNVMPPLADVRRLSTHDT